ncbi:MAG: C40 family peptidase [Clostridia bacterium]|nr:C40 family peptidase [Clostridia bacterium]MDE7328547.1 C40 family peptidase [Clostridia bacterium]
MKKIISMIISIITVCVVTAMSFAGCMKSGESEIARVEWAANWGAYSPSVTLPTPDTSIGGSSGENNGGGNTSTPSGGNNGGSGSNGSNGGNVEVPDTPQVVAPIVTYSSMIVSDTQNLNIRSAPSTSSSVLGIMDKGDMLRYEGTVNGWYKTVYKQKTAYVYAGNNYAHIAQMKQSSIKSIERIIAVGEELLGYPYVWGSQRYHWGNGVLNTSFVQGEFDCSALMQYIFYVGSGVLLDLNTRTQVLQGTKVADGDLQRGDVMFFTNASRYNNTGVERVGHVALYLGNNYILHTASDHAVIEEISSTRWSYFIVAKRFL